MNLRQTLSKPTHERWCNRESTYSTSLVSSGSKPGTEEQFRNTGAKENVCPSPKVCSSKG